MDEKQNSEFAHIVQQCNSGQYRSINVASKIRSDAIIAAWCELNSLRINLEAALGACYKALNGMYDQHPQYETMSGDELSHPDLDCYAVRVIMVIRAAIAKENEDMETVCSLPYGHTDDAALIAAAPELLGVCKAIDENALSDATGRYDDYMIPGELMQKLRAEIVRAEATQ